MGQASTNYFIARPPPKDKTFSSCAPAKEYTYLFSANSYSTKSCKLFHSDQLCLAAIPLTGGKTKTGSAKLDNLQIQLGAHPEKTRAHLLRDLHKFSAANKLYEDRVGDGARKVTPLTTMTLHHYSSISSLPSGSKLIFGVIVA